jgi:transcriptional regulator with XRE-family HTH domain
MRKKKPGPPKGQKISDVKRTPVGQRLFHTRIARGLTQQELGKRIGLSKRMVAHYESDSATPPLDVLTSFADALGVTVSYLLGESTQKKIDTKIKPLFRRHLEILQKLPLKEQKTVIDMVEGLELKNRVAGNKSAYEERSGAQ